MNKNKMTLAEQIQQEEKIKRIFSQNLKHLLDSSPYNAKQLSDHLMLKASTVYSFLNGVIPRPKTLTQIADLFGVSVESLFTDKEIPLSPHQKICDAKLIGENLRRLRERKGLTVENVREYLYFSSVQAIYNYEAGKRLPSADIFLALLDLYDVKDWHEIISPLQSD